MEFGDILSQLTDVNQLRGLVKQNLLSIQQLQLENETLKSTKKNQDKVLEARVRDMEEENTKLKEENKKLEDKLQDAEDDLQYNQEKKSRAERGN